MCFKERLERSHTFALSRAERALLTISTAAAPPASGGSSSSSSVSDALAAAVKALPVSHLDSVDWRGMRFNDDYTTRLPWLPPIQGPRHLVVLLWWEQQQAAAVAAGSNGSGGAQWWRQVAAAEADVPQAAVLRGVMMAAAQQRWLLPHLLHAALQIGSGSSNAGTDSGASCLASLLARYAAALGCASVQDLEAQLAACFGAGRSTAGAPAPAASRQLQLLDAALFSLAWSMQVLLLPSSPAETAAPEAAAAAVAVKAQVLSAALQALQQHLEQHLTPEAAYQGCLLPGHVLSLATLLLHEGCTWLLLCLEVRRRGRQCLPA